MTTPRLMSLTEFLAQDELWLNGVGEWIKIEFMTDEYRFKAAAWLLRRSPGFFQTDNSATVQKGMAYATSYMKMTTTPLYKKLLETVVSYADDVQERFQDADVREAFDTVYEDMQAYRRERIMMNA